MFLIAWQGAMLAAITLATYIWSLNSYGEGAHARTVGLFALVGVQLGHLFNCRSRTRSTFEGFFSNSFIFVAVAIVVGLQLLAVLNPFLANLLGLEPPNLADWLVIVVATLLPIPIVEITKAIARGSKA
jgi:Ca2+-transporting ATPase